MREMCSCRALAVKMFSFHCAELWKVRVEFYYWSLVGLGERDISFTAKLSGSGKSFGYNFLSVVYVQALHESRGKNLSKLHLFFGIFKSLSCRHLRLQSRLACLSSSRSDFSSMTTLSAIDCWQRQALLSAVLAPRLLSACDLLSTTFCIAHVEALPPSPAIYGVQVSVSYRRAL